MRILLLREKTALEIDHLVIVSIWHGHLAILRFTSWYD